MQPPTAQFFTEIFSPRPPLATSLATTWQSLVMVHMRQPAYEFAEVALPLHGVAIFANSARAERKIDDITQQESIEPGNIVVVPANVGHSVRWQGELELIFIGLNPALFDYAINDASNLDRTELIPHFATPDPLVYQIGLALKNVLATDPHGSRLYAETTASMLSIHLLQRYSHRKLEFKDYADGLPRSTLQRVIEYIRSHLDRELGLTELAEISHLSPHYFTRLFKRSTGLTPHQFVIQCRVERAKDLLLQGKDSIVEIAQQVGFANQAHLNVHIKRSLGVTPKQILQQSKHR
jgi:AraC family transcriptional regulator